MMMVVVGGLDVDTLTKESAPATSNKWINAISAGTRSFLPRVNGIRCRCAECTLSARLSAI